MSSYSATAATRRGSIVPPLSGVDAPLVEKLPGKCDVLISGTGLTESVLAAALAWQGVDVLHVDKNAYYGDASAILDAEQLPTWVDEVNKGAHSTFSKARLYIPRPLAPKKQYLVDLAPKIMFARSDLLDLLIKSRVSRYLEFKALGSFHTYEQDSFDKVAGSKGDIFADQSLSLMTKRLLMKFIKFVLEWEEHEEVWESYKSSPVAKFMIEKFKLEKPQITELVLTIGLCDDLEVTTPVALSRIKRYLTSYDVYGQFPVLYSMYGSAGEISQGFCRSAAVAGATYKLGTALKDFDAERKVAVLSDGSSINVQDCVVASTSNLRSSDRLFQQTTGGETVTRLVAIVRKSCHEWFAENESAAVISFPPGTLTTGNTKAVHAIIFGAGSGQVPEGRAIWHLATSEQNYDKAHAELEEAISKLEANIIRESTEDFEIEVNENELSYRGDIPVISSVKLGQSMQNFVPTEKLQYLLKLSYVQNVDTAAVADAPLLYSSRPSSEISFDGVVAEARKLFETITGSDEDFFDVDFEDEDEEAAKEELEGGANGSGRQEDVPHIGEIDDMEL